MRLSEAQHEQMLLSYQQTIQGAFRDVSNALVAYRKDREFRIQQQNLLIQPRTPLNCHISASTPAPPITWRS